MPKTSNWALAMTVTSSSAVVVPPVIDASIVLLMALTATEPAMPAVLATPPPTAIPSISAVD